MITDRTKWDEVCAGCGKPFELWQRRILRTSPVDGSHGFYHYACDLLPTKKENR